MTRRAFLVGSGSAAALSAVPAFPGAIDTHTHFYDPLRPEGVPWPPKGDVRLYRRILPKEFRAHAERHGVAGTLVVEASPWLEDNQWLLDLAGLEPVIVGVVGHLQPGTAEFRSHLARFAKNPLFRGMRLGGGALAKGLERAEFGEDLRQLEAAGLTLDVLGGPAVLPAVARLAGSRPDLRIVIDHLPFEQMGEPMARAASASPRVYAKVSGVLRLNGGRFPDRALDEIWSVFGPDRVLYGSNWPVSDRAAPYGEVFRTVHAYFTSRGPEAARKYFRENSRAAYGWVERQAG